MRLRRGYTLLCIYAMRLTAQLAYIMRNSSAYFMAAFVNKFSYESLNIVYGDIKYRKEV